MHTRHPIASLLIAAAAAAPAVAGGDVVESWVRRLDGPAGMNDYGTAVAMGSDGSVYMAGFAFEEVGAGLFAPRFATVRYSPDGTAMWNRSYAGTFASGAAAAYHIAIDPMGDIVVSGSTNQGGDWAVVKYDPDGTERWRAVYEASSTFLTQPDDMAIDVAGNIYLVGYIGDPINPAFGGLVKFAPSGAQEWEERYYGPTFDGAILSTVCVEGTDAVYVAGGVVIPDSASDLCIVKYDGDGNRQWTTLDGSFDPNAHDRAIASAVDASGHVVLAGRYGGNSFLGLDIATLRVDPSGKIVWRTMYDGPAAQNDQPTDIAVTGDGSVIVVGSSENATFGDTAALTVRYDVNGAVQWDRRVEGDDIHADFATAVTVDAAGNAYVTGTYDPIGGAHYFAVRYDPDGTQTWLQDYVGPTGTDSTGWDIAVGADGAVAVTGDSPGIGTQSDIATIRYEQPGSSVPGDIDGDGLVGVTDLLALLEGWGGCANCAACRADLDGDCAVATSDLLILLANWS